MNQHTIKFKAIKLQPLIELFDLESAKLGAISKNLADQSEIFQTTNKANATISFNKILNEQFPKIAVGDTVQIDVLIQEIVKSEEKAGLNKQAKNNKTVSQGKKIIKERIQSYSGVVIAIKNKGINKNITVRRLFQGIGVERVFNLVSPSVNKIHILKRASVRRAKLYYLRNKQGKAAKLKEKI
uniref:Large ribosomal subunit protein bL19c n=1 Tax=Pleurastrum terricola TaxID=34116 RepID=A6YG73_PLETE|nr:ribosomal protein L19 [Pleurastrum terricola]ABO69294.1 ribosomal protein L19 [Pleurastrum terricola]